MLNVENPVTIPESKAALRSEIVKRLAGLPVEYRKSQSQLAVDRVSQHPAWASAGNVFLFVPFGTEIDLWPLAILAKASGKRVCVPAFDPLLRSYRPKELPDPIRDLVDGRMGIREPGPGCVWFDPAALDFLIVPGLAYDPKGGRLGRGRGHYDRLLPHSRGVTCGVGFDEQIVPQVPVESHDVKLNAVLTPTRAWGAGTR